MFKTLIRPAMIFIPFALGALFPQAHVLNDPPWNAVRWSLTVMVFLSSLQIRFSDLKFRREHWLVLGINLLAGIVPYFLIRLFFPAEDALAEAAFFVGITPTATAAPVVVSFLNGRVGFALTGFTVTNIFIPVALLGLLPLAAGEFTFDFIAKVAVTLLQIIALPFFLSVAAGKLRPGLRELPKRCKTFSFSLWAFTLFVLASVARQHFIDNPGESLRTVFLIALVSLLLCAANFYIGGLVAKRRYARETSQILGQKNTTFTMYLALHYANPVVALGPIFYILWHNAWNAWQMYRYDSRRLERERSGASSGRRGGSGGPSGNTP